MGREGLCRNARALTRALWLLAALVGSPARALAACGGPALEPVSAHVWRVPVASAAAEPHAGVSVQLAVVIDSERLWLIGSGPSSAFGTALACVIQQRLGRRVTDVVITRAAPGLALGQAAFEGARRWALVDVAVQLHERCASCRRRVAAQHPNDAATDPIRLPTHRIGPGAAGRLGPFEWRALPRAPGERTLVLRHRADAVVIAQGLLWAGDVPDLRETQGTAMRASWHTLRRFAQGATLVGEQGPAVAADAVDRHLAYLGTVEAAIDHALQQGDDRPAFGHGVPLLDEMSGPSAAHRHPLNLQRLHREREQARDQARETGRQSSPRGVFQRSLR